MSGLNSIRMTTTTRDQLKRRLRYAVSKWSKKKKRKEESARTTIQMSKRRRKRKQ